MLKNEDGPTAPHTAATPSSPTAAASLFQAAASYKLVWSVKASQTKPTTTLYAAFVKKKLFPIPSDHWVPPINPDGGHKGYKKKEDEMWTKSFEL